MTWVRYGVPRTPKHEVSRTSRPVVGVTSPPPPTDARLTVTLDDATLNARAAVGNNCRLAVTLDDATLNAKAATNNCRLAVTLDNATLNARAAAGNNCRAAVTLEGASIAAQADVTVKLNLERNVKVVIGSDDFNRADEDLEASGEWVDVESFADPPSPVEGVIVGNVVQLSGAGPPYWAQGQWFDPPASADCYAKITVAAVGDLDTDAYFVEVGLRGQPFAGGVYTSVWFYLYKSASGWCYVRAFNGSVATVNGFFNLFDIQAGDVFEFQIVGNSPRAFRNGVELAARPILYGQPHNMVVRGGRFYMHDGFYPTEPGTIDFYAEGTLTATAWQLDNFECGSLSYQLESATVAARAEALNAARLSLTLDDATVVSNAVVQDVRNATLTVTLDDATLAAQADALIDCRLTVTLDEVSLNADAAVGNDCRLAITLDDASLDSDAAAGNDARLSLTLDGASIAAQADALLDARLSLTLDDVTIVSTATVTAADTRNATLALTLDDVTIVANAAAANDARLAVTLDDASPNADAAVGNDARLAVTLDDASTDADAAAGNAARLSLTLDDTSIDADAISAEDFRAHNILDDVTISAQAQAVAGLRSILTLDSAASNAQAAVQNDLRLGVTLASVSLNARAVAGNDARVSVSLDDATIISRVSGQAVREASLTALLDDASGVAAATVADTPAVPPAVGGSGGGRRRRRAASTAAAASFAPPRLSPLPDIKPLPVIRARATITLDDAIAESRASPLTAMRGGVALGGARLAARAKVLPFTRPLDDARLKARATVDWSDVVADDDELLEILAA